MSTYKIFIAGSGGQGVILMGQMITYAAMYEGKEATFLPSYGPEMRGGTANCTVVVSDKPISCPLIYEADAVVAMNLPSMTKFEGLVKKGSKILINSTLIEERPSRDDIETVEVPANGIAIDLGLPRSANVIMLGALVRETGVVKPESIEKVLHKTFTGRKEHLYEPNVKAFYAWNK